MFVPALRAFLQYIHGIGDFSVRRRKLKYNVKIPLPSPPLHLRSNQIIIGCVDQSTLVVGRPAVDVAFNQSTVSRGRLNVFFGPPLRSVHPQILSISPSPLPIQVCVS